MKVAAKYNLFELSSLLLFIIVFFFLVIFWSGILINMSSIYANQLNCLWEENWRRICHLSNLVLHHLGEGTKVQNIGLYVSCLLILIRYCQYQNDILHDWVRLLHRSYWLIWSIQLIPFSKAMFGGGSFSHYFSKVRNRKLCLGFLVEKKLQTQWLEDQDQESKLICMGSFLSIWTVAKN